MGTLPAVVVFLTTYFILKQYLDNEQKKKLLEINMKNHELVAPLRFQAYERMVLFLERITPMQLIVRVMEPGMDVNTLQRNLIAAIRQEFDHNLSQQLYISSQAWEMVKNAKEETVHFINSGAMQLQTEALGTELAKIILEQFVQTEITALRNALDFVKNEFRSIS
jgi:hypothetical protein